MAVPLVFVPHAPSLRTVLAWAIQSFAEAQTRAIPPPPPDPATSWEAFAGSRLEWTAEAAAPIDLLYMAYAHWAAARGEPLLPEAQVLAWLEQRGARVTTAPLSQVTTVQGVRVVD
jgi:hypothetical protein